MTEQLPLEDLLVLAGSVALRLSAEVSALPEGVRFEAVYPFTHVEMWEMLICRKAAKLSLKSWNAEPILLQRDGGTCPYRGATIWSDHLKRLGVPRTVIVSLDGALVQDPNLGLILHTASECPPVVKWCVEHDIKNLVMTAWPPLLVRAFVSMVTAVLDANSTLNVWVSTTQNIDWSKQVSGSQGIPQASAVEAAKSEIRKIAGYKNLRLSEVHSYMDARDTRAVSK